MNKKTKPALLGVTIAVLILSFIVISKLIYEATVAITPQNINQEDWLGIQGALYIINLLTMYSLARLYYTHNKLNFITNTDRNIDCCRLIFLALSLCCSILYVNGFVLLSNEELPVLKNAGFGVALLTFICSHFYHNYRILLQKTASCSQATRDIAARCYMDAFICAIYVVVIVYTTTDCNISCAEILTLLF